MIMKIIKNSIIIIQHINQFPLKGKKGTLRKPTSSVKYVKKSKISLELSQTWACPDLQIVFIKLNVADSLFEYSSLAREPIDLSS